ANAIGASAAMLLPPRAAVAPTLTPTPPITGLSKFNWVLMVLPAPHACWVKLPLPLMTPMRVLLSATKLLWPLSLPLPVRISHNGSSAAGAARARTPELSPALLVLLLLL